jgi:hypothetical protein
MSRADLLNAQAEALEWAGYHGLTPTQCRDRAAELLAKAEAAKAAEDWQHLNAFGYAPGNYMHKCQACKTVVGDLDKRAITCRPCAKKAFAASKAADPPAGRAVCPDCFRFKARNADDCAAGDCSKWYAVMDNEADLDCKHFREKTGYFAHSKALNPQPVAWRIEEPEDQWFTDDLEEATDSLTNYDGVAVPLFEGPDPRIAELERLLREAEENLDACTTDEGPNQLELVRARQWLARIRAALKGGE